MLTRRFMMTSAAMALALAGPALAQDRLSVVASFSILGDIVAQVGGDRVEVATLVGPESDAHVYQPSPQDARAVTAAALVVVNGLGFEGWIARLIEASSYQGPLVVAADGIVAIAAQEGAEKDDHAGHDAHAEHKHPEHAHDDHAHDDHAQDDHAHDHDTHGDHEDHAGHDHGDFDPHAWQDPRNVMTYARNIAAGLELADPAGAETYRANLAAYLSEVADLDAEIRAQIATIPPENRQIVTSHDSFGYFARAYGLTFVSPQGMSTEAEASARDVAALIRQIKDQGIKAVFVENVADTRLLEQITRETGAVIGGSLYSDALSMPVGPAPTYTAMMRHNVQQLVSVLAP